MKKLFLFCIFLLIGCSGKSNLSISELSKQLDQLELNKIPTKVLIPSKK